MKNILQKELDKIEEKGLTRNLRTINSSPDKEIIMSGKSFLNFSSNNYLGLSTHPEVKKAAIHAIEKYGAGGTSSRLISGSLDIHKELEENLASLKKTESAIVFPTGYQANIGIITSLLSEGDCLIMDKLNHASLWDAAKLSKARIFVYKHNDMNCLEKILKRSSAYKKKLIVVDSLFSMDGDFAPLKEIVFLAEKYSAWTMIDEAHATGIWGANGEGMAGYFHLENKINIIMGTFSKAIGSQGGFVCGTKELIKYLINKSRPFIYTTALAPSCAAAAITALNIIKNEPERRQKLIDLSSKLKNRLNCAGFNTLNSESQIIPLITGPVTETVSLAAKLWKDRLFVPAIRPPTVLEGECRLRISITSSHCEEDISKLFESIVS